MCYYNAQQFLKSKNIQLGQYEKTINSNLPQKDILSGFDYGTSIALTATDDHSDIALTQMEWGFIPFYIHDRNTLKTFREGGINHKSGKFDPPIITLNAMGETLLQKITYKKAAAENRCLIPSTGFYEWRHIHTINKRTGLPNKTAIKYPYYIHLPAQPYFFMAGIYNPWTDQSTGEHVNSFAIVTTQANGLMEKVHNHKKRMPVILNEALATKWIFEKISNEEIINIATTQYPSIEMQAYSIEKDFLTSSAPQSACVYPDLPPL